MIKKLLFTVVALAIAVGMGIGVFYWTGGDSSELRRKGREVGKKLRKDVRRSTEVVNGAKEKVINPEKKSPEIPPAPPMEEINEKDRKKLEGLLNE